MTKIVFTVGKRYLMQTREHFNYTFHGIHEYTILEVSPSGDYVKLQGPTGLKFWHQADDEFMRIIEEL